MWRVMLVAQMLAVLIVTSGALARTHAERHCKGFRSLATAFVCAQTAARRDTAFSYPKAQASLTQRSSPAVATSPSLPCTHCLRPFACRWRMSTAGSSNEAKASSRHGVKFQDMLDQVRTFSLAQVMCLEDEVTRTIIVGLVDGSKVPEVEKAFRILYEDFPPIRLAGNLLFDMIQRAIDTCPVLEWDDDSQPLTDAAVRNARNLFSIADTDDSGYLDDGEIRRFLDKLQALGWTVDRDKERLLQLAEQQGSRMKFASFPAGAPHLFRLPEEEQQALVQELAAEWLRDEGEGETGAEGNGSGERRGDKPAWRWSGHQKRAKYEHRFAEMISTVDAWREGVVSISGGALPPVPSGGGGESSRLHQVLHGALIGATCPTLVEALRCVYVEYAPLRMGGDLIFSLLKSALDRDQ